MLDGGKSSLDLFRKRLKKGSDAVHADQSIMQEYHKGKVGISVVKKAVFDNNSIPQEIRDEISTREFEAWVRGLGY